VSARSSEASGRLVGVVVTGSAVVFALGAFVAYRLSRDPVKAQREPTTWDDPPAAVAPAAAGGVCAEPTAAGSVAPGCASAAPR
jgi:ABC-type branched-subunit amino acid transport system permease subunit